MTMRRLLMAGLLLATLGCGNDGDPMDPGDNNNDPGSLPAGTFTARIDGQQWTAAAPLAAAYNGGVFALGGSNSQLTTIAFAVITNGQPGTYPIGPTIPTNGILTIGASGPTWIASAQGGSGSIIITSISTTGATGTFSFNMIANGTSGSTGTKTVTNGAFNVTF
jgi:hypothetical protein